MQEDSYDFQVALKYQLYNSIFLTLHFATIRQTGIELPLFSAFVERKLAEGMTPLDIIRAYFAENRQYAADGERQALLFRFVQYVERQIVLIDALEESAYDKLNDLNGPGSLEHLLGRVREAGRLGDLASVLGDFRIKMVLTAHPTQFYPGYVLGIINDLAEAFQGNDLHRIRLLLEQLGQTPFYHKKKPSPLDEAVSLGWYLENIFYQAIPQLVHRLQQEPGLEDFDNPRLIEVGFWPGGDRDGNPFVTADITLQVARRLQFLLYKAYYNDVRRLKRRLTFRDTLPAVEALEETLRYTLFEPQGQKAFDLEGFRRELLHLQRVLERDHNGFFADEVRLLLIKTRLFGNHFAALDIRQDSRVIHRAFNRLYGFGEGQGPSQAEYGRLQKARKAPDTGDPVLDDLYAVFRTVVRIQESSGEQGCNRFIISNCRQASSVLEVYAMAGACGMPRPVALDIAPLFETMDDLARAHEVMAELYALPYYREHLRRRHDRQYIMLGFSDGTKDGGYFSANWAIFKAKERLTQTAREHGVEVVFFDGRGGPPARGGGNVRKFYAAQGSKIANSGIQLTIQGQTVSSRFSSVGAACHYIGNLLTAGLENRLFTDEGGRTGEFDADLQEIADLSFEAYRKLKERPDFMPYLEHRSPLKFFGKTNIGSRPSKRGQSDKLTLDDLRAIPFVGSWSAMKQNVPGYYGLGKALEKVAETRGHDHLARLYHGDPFFASLVNNSMQSLSKSRMALTQYLKDDAMYGGLWTDINEENGRTRRMITDLLEGTGWEEALSSMASIELRESVVLPLLVIQQYALMELERAGGENDVYESLIIRTLYGIINAARNSA